MDLNHQGPRLPTGSNSCRCAACGHYFGGVRAFEMHRDGPAGERHCLATSGMRDTQGQLLLRLNDKGYWVREYRDRTSKPLFASALEYGLRRSSQCADLCA